MQHEKNESTEKTEEIKEIVGLKEDGLSVIEQICGKKDISEDCFARYYFSYQVFESLIYPFDINSLKSYKKENFDSVHNDRINRENAEKKIFENRKNRKNRKNRENRENRENVIDNYLNNNNSPFFNLYGIYRFNMEPKLKGGPKEDFFEQFDINSEITRDELRGIVNIVKKYTDGDKGKMVREPRKLTNKNFKYLIAIKLLYSFFECEDITHSNSLHKYKMNYHEKEIADFLLNTIDKKIESILKSNCTFLQKKYKNEEEIIKYFNEIIGNEIPNNEILPNDDKELFKKCLNSIFKFIEEITKKEKLIDKLLKPFKFIKKILHI
ncbi:MAG: hypothetical protein LBM93_03265 [Oscillospiraceae bacterium]|jgi:hypothetical protein|nr:hypothetical protein [Oscillospiraceae bacterium]